MLASVAVTMPVCCCCPADQARMSTWYHIQGLNSVNLCGLGRPVLSGRIASVAMAAFEDGSLSAELCHEAGLLQHHWQWPIGLLSSPHLTCIMWCTIALQHFQSRMPTPTSPKHVAHWPALVGDLQSLACLVCLGPDPCSLMLESANFHDASSVASAQDTQESLAEPDPTATPGATVTEEHEQQEKQQQEATPADRPSTAPPEPSVPGTPDSIQPQVQYNA